jgi:hypothetical protein
MGYVCLVYAIKSWTVTCLAVVLLPAKIGVVKLDSYGALGFFCHISL